MFLKINNQTVININACNSIAFSGSYDDIIHRSQLVISFDGKPTYVLRHDDIIYFLKNNDLSVLPRQVREIIEQAVVESGIEEFEIEKRG
jgi:hypothetical protein